jgi:hypothetical protein
VINKEMNDNKSEDNKKEVADVQKPHETGGIYLSSSLKITDPNTEEVLVQVRGDS